MSYTFRYPRRYGRGNKEEVAAAIAALAYLFKDAMDDDGTLDLTRLPIGALLRVHHHSRYLSEAIRDVAAWTELAVVSKAGLV